jgi:hypothetical protein
VNNVGFAILNPSKLRRKLFGAPDQLRVSIDQCKPADARHGLLNSVLV